ncbi:Calx-beta domain-containing protein [Pseudofulvibacter geojedonensis]|uniref:Calx-beta domain-containing protein n=1 Tax=Pseudofulvibacter geojedonensis TaxID=1123758 RepID=A0ABW3HZA0_9FLAO
MNKFLYLAVLLVLTFSCTDDEGVNFQPDNFFLGGNTSVNEADGTTEITFNLLSPVNNDVTINFELTGTAVSPDDYSVAGLSVVLPAGETSVSLVVNLVDDNLIEEQEDIVLTVTTISDPNIFVNQSDTLTITIIDDESIAYQSGVLIANKGGAGVGTVSYIKNDLSAVEQQIYSAVNGENIGNGLQSIAFHNDKAYLIVSGANKIIVVNRYSFFKEATIETGLNNPRYMTVSGDKAYVTNWNDPNVTDDDYVAVVDLATNSIDSNNDINVAEGPERILARSGKLYISHKGGINQNNKVSVIPTSDVTNITTIPVGDVPDEMVFDSANNIWVLCEGNPASSGSETGGKLVKINTTDDTMVTTIDFTNATDHPNTLSYYNGKLYYALNNSIYDMLETETTVSTTAILTTPAYTIAINNDKLYVSDVVDSVANGSINVYNLADNNASLGTLTVGVHPEAIYFN